MDKFFEILELSPDASWDDVKKSYRELAQVWHPDKHQNANDSLRERAHKKLTEINDAYRGLDSFFQEQHRRKIEEEEREQREKEEREKRAKQENERNAQREAENSRKKSQTYNSEKQTYKPYEPALGDWIWFWFCMITLITVLALLF
jgi:curved DNA-binding protein CbpA